MSRIPGTRIHVTIDRLSLPDTAGVDRPALVAALETELRTILSDRETRAAWARPHRTPVLRLQAGPLEPGAAGARKFGVGVAQAIGKGLKP